MARREIVQIAATSYLDNDCALYALAKDGTLWELNYLEPSNWRQVPPLPEDLVSIEDHNPKHKLPLTVPQLELDQ